MSDDELLTVAEVAERLKMHQQTIRNWVDQGELPAVRLGSRRVRILQSDLDTFIAGSAPAQAPSEPRARQAYADALDAVTAAAEPGEEASALPALAKAATGLARVLSR